MAYYYRLYVNLRYYLYCFPKHDFLAPISTYKDNKQIIKITKTNGKKISVIYIKNKQAKYTLLHSHGNAEDLGILLSLLDIYNKMGFSVLAYDYSGYGTSEGRSSEAATYSDIEAAYQYLLKQVNVKPENIILIGRSLGSGPSLYLASKQKVAGVILESPFLTAFRAVTQIPMFPVDRYRNNRRITEFTAPVLILHGTEDEVVPYWHGKRLFDIRKQPKYFIGVEGAGHNNLIEFMGKRYKKELVQFANNL